MDLDKLSASDGTGEAVRSLLTLPRTAGSTVFTPNSMVNWPQEFVATTGPLLANGTLDPDKALVFRGHINGSTYVLDELAPGYTDTYGSAVGDVIVLKPTTWWADTLVDAVKAMGSTLYPIGSIYTNATVSTNPSTLLGFGTWVAFGAGRVPVGVDAAQTEFDTLGETGGAKTNTLTQGNLPSGVTGFLTMHSTATGTNLANAVGGVFSASSTNANTYRDGGSANTGASSLGGLNFNLGGSSTAVNNLQPYITVYMWKRTA